MQLTEHFTLEEFVVSNTAMRLGIDNTASDEITINLIVVANEMEKIRTFLGDKSIRINSGYRCEELEKVLCAKDFGGWCSRHGKDKETAWPEYFANKGHPKGFCADFVCPDFGTPTDIVAALRKTDLVYDQLILEGTWVHVSFAPAARMMAMSATFDNGVPSYQILSPTQST